jgi:phenylalanyl-tRNA synthetase beta subunit
MGSNPDQCYSLQNPINAETPYLRDAMIYNLLGYASKNGKFFDSFRIFDIGNVLSKTKEKKSNDKNIYATSFVHESLELGAMMYEKSINSRDKDPFLTMKSMISPLMHRLGIMGNITFKASSL